MIYIVSVEYNRPDVWALCLPSWKRKALSRDNIKVYYVDNGSPEPDIIQEQLDIFLDKGIVDKFHMEEYNVGPSKARNFWWSKLLDTIGNNDIIVKADGDLEVMVKNWEKNIVYMFSKRPDVGVICYGNCNRSIPNDDNCVTSYPFPLIFVRGDIAKDIGLFQDYTKETGTTWGCDDQDYIYRASSITTVMMIENNMLKHYDRPEKYLDDPSMKRKGDRRRALLKWFRYYDNNGVYVK